MIIIMDRITVSLAGENQAIQTLLIKLFFPSYNSIIPIPQKSCWPRQTIYGVKLVASFLLNRFVHKTCFAIRVFSSASANIFYFTSVFAG